MRADRLLATLVLIGLTWASGLPAAEEQPTANRLTVRIVGLRTNEGTVGFALFDSEESFKKRERPVEKAFVAIDGLACEWVVEGLPTGVYAVAVYHDKNANEKLDKRRHGPPKEPYGFSNNARATFGPPAFSKAKFELTGDRTIEIEVR